MPISNGEKQDAASLIWHTRDGNVPLGSLGATRRGYVAFATRNSLLVESVREATT